MNVLLTGAFGNLGLLCLEQLLSDGHRVRCTDIDAAPQRRSAAPFRDRCDVQLGDIRDTEKLATLVDGVDAIIHLASLLPPHTDTQPELAEAVNVGATKALIDLASAQPNAPLFIFPSSLTVFGPSRRDAPQRAADDPTQASDHYTRHKLIIEDYLKQASLPWVVMRIGVSVDARTTKTERSVLRQLLNVHPDTPLEYIHPRDVALAMSRALSTPQVQGKTLLLGGGERCQIRHHQFLNAAFSALGMPQRADIHGDNNYYTHWLDTREAQALLGFQQHGFDDYQRELAEKFSGLRRWSTPLRPLIRPLLPVLLKRL